MMDGALLYNYIYSHAHPTRGRYGAVGRRDPLFVNYLVERVPPPSLILDAGCGRGTLMRWLIGLGYSVCGTEIASWLVTKAGDLHGLPVVQVSYEEMSKESSPIPPKTYDVVISNDVLEHLGS